MELDIESLLTRYEEERDRELRKLPVCSECDEYIQDEYCYEINGELICPDCIERNHRKFTKDYTE